MNVLNIAEIPIVTFSIFQMDIGYFLYFAFWIILINLSRRGQLKIQIQTHVLNFNSSILLIHILQRSIQYLLLQLILLLAYQVSCNKVALSQ